MKWLFLVHQVQTPNSRERVKVWRLLKKVGAILHRNSVYVLPYNKERLEDFQWLCQQIRDSKGEASVFISESQDPKEDRLLRDLFETSRKQDYEELFEASRQLLERIKSQKHDPSGLAESAFQKEVRELEEKLADIQKIDFFSRGTPEQLLKMIDQLKKQLQIASSDGSHGAEHALIRHYKRNDFLGKKWTTRDNIYIDRIATAWFIRRFIDRRAKFIFAPENQLPPNAIPFDVFGAEFSHQGEDCTFETMLKAFRIRDAALETIAQIVHDIDLKDRKFGRPEAPGVDATIRALSRSMKDDHQLLEVGSLIFDGLYAGFSPKGPVKKKR